MTARWLLGIAAAFSAAIFLILAGVVVAGGSLSAGGQIGACLLLAALFVAEAIRGLRGAS